MTGLELLKEEMRKRGATKEMIESKTLPMVLDIVAETGNVYSDYWLQMDEIKDKKRRLFLREQSVDTKMRRLDKYQKAFDDAVKEFNKETKEYIEKFQQSLKECETAEGRDRMRIAQMFVNSVDVNTKYDNTAFIIGFATILSSGEIGTIDELKKINPKVFGTNLQRGEQDE